METLKNIAYKTCYLIFGTPVFMCIVSMRLGYIIAKDKYDTDLGTCSYCMANRARFINNDNSMPDKIYIISCHNCRNVALNEFKKMSGMVSSDPNN